MRKLLRLSLFGFMVLLLATQSLASPLPANTITPERLKTIATEHIAKHVPVCEGCTLNVQWQKLPTESYYHLPAGGGAVSVEASSNLEHFVSSHSLIRLKLSNAAGQTRLVGLPVIIGVERPVWVVTHAVAPGQALTAKQLSQRTQLITDALPYQLPPETVMSAYEARVALRPGQVIDSRFIRLTPTIQAQQEVRIRVKTTGNNALTISGKALELGYTGQCIRVQQTQPRRKEYKATVLGPGLVQVVL